MNLLYIPAVLLMACFVLYPLARGIYISFFKWNGYSQNMTFIGLKNYADSFKSALFFKAVKNTIVYTVVVVPLSLLIAFSIAIMILPFKKGVQSVFKSIYYLPGIASVVALSVVWLWLGNTM